jgi:hypothetical protein
MVKPRVPFGAFDLFVIAPGALLTKKKNKHKYSIKAAFKYSYSSGQFP